jgi:integrase
MPSDLAAFYRHLETNGRKIPNKNGEKGLSLTTVRLVHTVIHRILTDAIEDNIRKDNPASSKAAKPPTPKMMKASQPEKPTWTPDQLRRFLDFIQDARHGALWALLGSTGMRRGAGAAVVRSSP